MSTFGAVVIGGGHNGLTAALTLAKAGKSVAVVERRAVLGGIAAGEAFGDGYRTRGLWDESCRVRPSVVAALGLAKHGLRFRERPPIFCAQANGPGLLFGGSVGAAELGDDVVGYRTLRAFAKALGPAARRLLEAPPPSIGDDAKLGKLIRPALDFRKLGKRDLMELLRVAPAPIDDWVTEEVSGPLLRALLCAEALPGTWMGPRSPTSTTTYLLGDVLADREIDGGPAALVDALVAAATKAGATMLTEREVTRIRVENGAVRGVETTGGDLDAPIVLSGIGPKVTLLDLLHPFDLPPALERDVSDIRHRGTMAKVHLALKEPLRFREGTPPERILLGAEDPLDLERGWDHVKHRRAPTNPPLYVRQWADGDAWIASITLHCAGHDIDGGWTDAARDALTDEVLGMLARYVPAVRDGILASETLTPADIEDRYALPGGHPFHGELALDQLGPLRPTPRLARFRTPIGGLFLGSSGMHPGFGVTCAPGALAAKEALS